MDELTCPSCGSLMDEAYTVDLGGNSATQRFLSCPNGCAPAASLPPAASLAMQKAREARSAEQPEGWGNRVYLSVSGLRWVCCGNLFEDEHSPWCQQGPPLMRRFPFG